MAVKLLKQGNRVNLTKGTGLKKALAGLGWDINRYSGSKDFDLDLVFFECDANKRCISEKHMIYYFNREDPEKAILHSGDNRTGKGDGDDESATIDFTKLNPEVKYIIVAVTIYNAKANEQSFGMVDNSYIHLANVETNEDLLKFELCEEFDDQTSVIFAEIYEKDGEWKFNAVGKGYNKELEDLCHEYGLETE